MDRGHDVAPGLERDRKPLAGDRSEAGAGLRHQVADDVRLAEDALRGKGGARTVVRAEEEPGQLVDLDARSFLGHRQVSASEPRFDVRERNGRLGRRTRSGERRVRVAVDEHEVRLLTTDDLGDARAP